jgi:hypothetical protein
VLFPLSTATSRDSLSDQELSQRLVEISNFSAGSSSKTTPFPPPSLLVMGTPDVQHCAFLSHDQKHQSAKSSSSSSTAERTALAQLWSTVTTLTVANVYQCAAQWFRWSMQCGVLAYQCTLSLMGNVLKHWFNRHPSPQPDNATSPLTRESRPHGD